MDDPPPARRHVEVQWGAGTRIAALAAGRALALLPRRWRFRAVLLLARLTAPVAVALLARAGYAGVVVGRRDAMVRVLCRAMTAAGTHFDPEVRYDGPDDLSGALLVSGHFPLNALVTRYLFDRGTPPAVVKVFPLADPYYWGSFVRDEVFDLSPAVLVKVRNALARGRPVFIDIDGQSEVTRGITATTAYGTGGISSVIFELARRIDVPVYFACGRSERTGLPLVFIRRIEPEVNAFLAHFREQAERIV